MKRLSLLIIVPLFLSWTLPIHPLDKPSSSPIWSIYFSPNGGCTEAIVHELNNAKNSILMQAYSFTSAPIAKALLNAYEKGLKSRSSWIKVS